MVHKPRRSQSQSYKLYLHLFLDSANVVRDEKRLAEKVFGLRDKVLRHDGNLSEKRVARNQQYLILSKVGSGRTITRFFQ